VDQRKAAAMSKKEICTKHLKLLVPLHALPPENI
jgi:hypothetical protein